MTARGKPYRHYIAVIAVAVVIASGYAASSDVNVVDVIADIMFTTILDAAYAVHGVLSLNITSSITNSGSLELGRPWGITTFESGGHTYAAVAASTDDGVQILNITDPTNITAAGHISDSVNLNAARGITTFESGGHTYAAVTRSNNGVQILDVTNPASITTAGSITDSGSLKLGGARGITTFESGGHTYAAVAAYTDDGVQILNVTNPAIITTAGSIGKSGDIKLDGARGITTFESGGHTYAAVAAYNDGVQILDVTNPAIITAAGSITNSDSLKLGGAEEITTFESGGHTYAAVTASTEGGVQILDVTTPSNITAAGSIGKSGDIKLDGATGISIFESGDHTYAAVAAYSINSVQILDVTNPANITAAGYISDSPKLGGAIGIATFESGDHIYAAVTAYLGDSVQIIRVDVMSDDTCRLS